MMAEVGPCSPWARYKHSHTHFGGPDEMQWFNRPHVTNINRRSHTSSHASATRQQQDKYIHTSSQLRLYGHLASPPTCRMPLSLHSTPSPGCTEPPAMMAKARLSLRCHSKILKGRHTHRSRCDNSTAEATMCHAVARVQRVRSQHRSCCHLAAVRQNPSASCLLTPMPLPVRLSVQPSAVWIL